MAHSLSHRRKRRARSECASSGHQRSFERRWGSTPSTDVVHWTSLPTSMPSRGRLLSSWLHVPPSERREIGRRRKQERPALSVQRAVADNLTAVGNSCCRFQDPAGSCWYQRVQIGHLAVAPEERPRLTGRVLRRADDVAELVQAARVAAGPPSVPRSVRTPLR